LILAITTNNITGLRFNEHSRRYNFKEKIVSKFLIDIAIEFGAKKYFFEFCYGGMGKNQDTARQYLSQSLVGQAIGKSNTADQYVGIEDNPLSAH
jgi:hypothetical protein